MSQIQESRKRIIKSALEAMMFMWGSPLSVKLAADVLEAGEGTVRECFDELCSEYSERAGGVRIRMINGKYQFCTAPENEPYVTRLCTPVTAKRLSNAAMEVLTIIAYRQPVSRSEIDFIRGVKSEHLVSGLQKKGLITEKGRGKGLGRPVLFGTTDFFLEKFGISSLSELPDIDDLDFTDDKGAPESAGSAGAEEQLQLPFRSGDDGKGEEPLP